MKSLKAKFRKSDTNEWNKNDERLLQAVDHGETDKVSALLGKKGVVATKMDSEGKTAFHLAATKGNADCLKVMLTHGTDVCAQDLSGHTALHLSVKHNHIECVKRLLQSKCPTECMDNGGRTCVHYAAANGNLPMLQVLCENKCLLTVKDSDGNTPLLISVQYGHLEACKCLLDHKADVNLTDKNGKSPLMLACEAGQFNMVDLLVHRGASLTPTDALGHDVLHYAKMSANPQILTLLLSKMSHETALRSPAKPQHDQANRLSSERSGTPKKRKAPPPPISPIQLSDMPSPLSSTSTPLSAKGEIFFSEKGSKDENTPYRRELRDRLSDSTGEDSLLDVSSEAEQQDTLSLLQAKVASLTLLNKELQDRLQEKAYAGALTDISDSFHSTQAELSFAKDKEAKSPAVISDNSDISFDSQPEGTKYELKMKQLEQTIEEMQMKLEESETIRRDLETHIQSMPAGCHASLSTETSEAPSDTDLQPQGSRNEQKDDTALKPNLQRMSRVEQDFEEEEGIGKSNDDNAMVLEEFEVLKREYQEVLAESERKENEMNDLRHQIDIVTQGIVNLVPIERQEEMEKSYCAVIEKLNIENSELTSKQGELLEEIKSLRKELESQKESVLLENGHEEEDRSTMIDELTKQVSELSLLYSEAQTELEKTRQASNHISSDFIHKDEHVKLLQEVEESKEKVENDLVDLASQHARILEELCVLKQQLDKEKKHTTDSELEKVIDDLKKQIETLKLEKNGLMEQLASQESRMKSLEGELQQEKVTVQESAVTKRLLAERQVSLEEEISMLSSRVGDMLKEKDKFSADNGQARRDIKQLKEGKEVLEGQLKLKEQKIDELCMKYEKVQEDLVEMKKLSENTSKVEEDKDKKISELSKEVSKLKDALNSLSQLSFTTSTPKRQSQQLESLQQQVKQLQNQLVETKKQHQEIVSVYRMHLLYAVQGQMDEDVQKVLKQILTMCKSQSQKM
ncbi:PREDICTED: ankycorbin [Nanorana parkeri]|uniref:ankycorbin n=1 Tax=Nanorana parkeri TaxID=125878 RepID=UPI000854B13E|nr:PREDICTED: ankycorbin [Nanorana parkeri]